MGFQRGALCFFGFSLGNLHTAENMLLTVRRGGAGDAGKVTVNYSTRPALWVALLQGRSGATEKGVLWEVIAPHLYAHEECKSFSIHVEILLRLLLIIIMYKWRFPSCNSEKPGKNETILLSFFTVFLVVCDWAQMRLTRKRHNSWITSIIFVKLLILSKNIQCGRHGG